MTNKEIRESFTVETTSETGDIVYVSAKTGKCRADGPSVSIHTPHVGSSELGRYLNGRRVPFQSPLPLWGATEFSVRIRIYR